MWITSNLSVKATDMNNFYVCLKSMKSASKNCLIVVLAGWIFFGATSVSAKESLVFINIHNGEGPDSAEALSNPPDFAEQRRRAIVLAKQKSIKWAQQEGIHNIQFASINLDYFKYTTRKKYGPQASPNNPYFTLTKWESSLVLLTTTPPADSRKFINLKVHELKRTRFELLDESVEIGSVEIPQLADDGKIEFFDSHSTKLKLNSISSFPPLIRNSFTNLLPIFTQHME